MSSDGSDDDGDFGFFDSVFDKKWEVLEPEQQAAALVLGYEQATWPTVDKEWGELQTAPRFPPGDASASTAPEGWARARPPPHTCALLPLHTHARCCPQANGTT